MQRIGDDNCASRVFARLSRIAQHQGDLGLSAELLRQSLLGFNKLGRNDLIILNLARFASLAELAGFKKRSARLLGAVEAYRYQTETVLAPMHEKEYDDTIRLFQKLSEDEIFKQYSAEGSSMSLDEAIEYALSNEDEQ